MPGRFSKKRREPGASASESASSERTVVPGSYERGSAKSINDQEGWHQVVDTGLVQNRITIAGFALALLAFTSSVLLAYVASTAPQDSASRADYALSAGWVYINTVIPIVLGFILAISSLLFLLMSQELKSASLFALGEIFLYLALAQSLAACLSRITTVAIMGAHYHLTGHPWVGHSIALGIWLLPLPLWLALVFGAPTVRIWRLPKRRCAFIGYIAALSLIMACSSLSYELRRPEPSGAWTLLKSFLKQTVQPLFW